jgi:hypothetical protein
MVDGDYSMSKTDIATRSGSLAFRHDKNDGLSTTRVAAPENFLASQAIVFELCRSQSCAALSPIAPQSEQPYRGIGFTRVGKQEKGNEKRR